MNKFTAPSVSSITGFLAGLRGAIPRMFDWLIAALLLTLLVWFIAPQQVPVSLYKVSLVALAAVAGYWIDRSLFPYARPHEMLFPTDMNDLSSTLYEAYCMKAGGLTYDGKPLPKFAELGADRQKCWEAAAIKGGQWVVSSERDGGNAGAAMLRRAIIVAATMLAVGLGA